MFFVKQKILIISYICEKNLKMNSKPVKGFSKLSKEAKMEWIADEYLGGDDKCINLLKSY